MYAIIQTGGKQFRVAQGDIIDVELLNVTESKVSFTDVRLFHDGSKATVGLPNVAGCIVNGEILEEVKGPKIIAFQYKRRKSCHRKVGHRQQFSRVKITAISKGE